jgi:membrane protein DedA with SNARE-associated domain
MFGGLEHYIRDYGTLAVFLGILLEDFGLPVPGETMLISAAVAASLGHIDIWLLLPFAVLGAVVGDNVGYAIGHFGGQRMVVRYGRHVGITKERLAKVEAFFERYGSIVVVFARFVVLLRQFNGIVAGTLEMHWARFLLYNAIGAILWVGFWGLLAFWLGKNVHAFIDRFHVAEPVLIAVAAAIAVIAVAIHFVRRSARRD